MYVLDLIVFPNGLVHTLPSQGLKRIVDVGQGNPAVTVQLAQQTLVGELHGIGVIVHVVDDLLEDGLGGIDNLQAAVHEAQRPDSRVRTDGLCRVRVVVLGREGAVCRNPVLWVMGLLERVADAGVAGGEDPLAVGTTMGGDGGVVQVHGHELVHVLQDEHVAVELDDPLVLGEAEGSELRPAVVEARVVAVVLCGLSGQEVLDLLMGDAAGLQSGDALLGEGVGVQGDQGIC